MVNMDSDKDKVFEARVQNFMEQNSLEYGVGCSYDQKQKRRAYNAELIELSRGGTTQAVGIGTDPKLTDLDLKYCDLFENFECGPNNEWTLQGPLRRLFRLTSSSPVARMVSVDSATRPSAARRQFWSVGAPRWSRSAKRGHRACS